jgi:hypothetical protein
MSATNKKTITVGVYGGMIQWIQGIPEDVRVVVYDYDIEGAGPEDLSQDAEGNQCIEAVWEANETHVGDS